MEPSQAVNFAEGPPVPEMRVAFLDAAKVRELIGDLLQFTRVLSVLCKTSGRSQSSPSSGVSLEQAAELLLNGDVQAIQVKYFYQEYEWADTLTRLPEGIRVVRCRHGIE